MVAIVAIIGAVVALAGHLGGKWFVTLLGLFLIAVPFLSGAILLGGIPWWVIFAGVVIFIYFLGGKKK